MSKGGGSSTPANTSNQTTTTVQLPAWAQSFAQQNAQQAQTLSQQGYTPYTGQMVAGMSPEQTTAINAVNALQGAGAAQQTYGQAIGNVSNLPGTTMSLLNPYLGNVESDTVSNIMRQSALQGQQNEAQAANVGAFGGTRDAVQEALLQSETQRNVGQAINQIQSQGWNLASSQALTQAQEMGQLATGGQNAALQGIGAQYTMGQQEQQQTQAELSNQYQQWQQQQNWPYQQLAIAQSALAGTPYGNTTTSAQPYSSNTAAQALGLASAGLPIVNQLGKWAGLWGGTGTGAASSAGKGAGDALGATGGAASMGTAATAAADIGSASAAGGASKGAGDAVAALAA